MTAAPGPSRLVGRLSERDRRIAALAVPALATVAVEPLYTLFDTGIVGRLGTSPLGGLALASVVLNASFWIFNFLSFGTTSRVALLTGRGDDRGAAGVASQGLWLCGCIGIPVGLALWAAAHGIAGLLGGHGAILAGATTYLRISALGMPFIFVSLVGNGYFRGLSDTRTPLRVVVVANVVNAVLEVLLVYVAHFGIAGSAWGTVIAQVLAAGWFVVLIARRIGETGASMRPVPGEMRRLVVVGRHLFVRTGALLATLTLATSVAARVGPSTLGAHQIALQVWLFVTLTFDALAIPAQALTGTLLGQGDVSEARWYADRLARLGALCGVAVGVVLVAASPLLPHAFTADGRVASRASAALVVVGVLQVPGAVLWVLDGVLMGASDFRFLQVSTTSALMAFLPVGAAVLVWHRLGVIGIWVGLSVWLLVRLAINRTRYRGTRWTEIAAGDNAQPS
ncbi:MAG TPA: MATE family efflux transporter [Acidimicrobiales bacterium]|jgi:putative MATE family efflux protein|nr:MATE family efflux transporter [Acidimicrobiales bacterium]